MGTAVTVAAVAGWEAGLDGTWEAINAALRERVRVRQGRAPTPSAAVLDSQSAKTTGRGAARLGRGQLAVTGSLPSVAERTAGMFSRSSPASLPSA